MHNFLPKIYYFIDHFNIDEIKKTNNKIALIYRNYEQNSDENLILKIKKFCKTNNRKFYISNNLKLAKKFNLDGIYIPSFNKDLNFRHFKKNNFHILGSAHNLKEIKIKEKQGVQCIFLSPIFKMKKYKQNLDILKFNNITKITNKKMIALGGINLKNYKRLKLVNTYGFASISFFKKTFKTSYLNYLSL
jgi:thiamine-phosphate pyrophosphorylase